MVRQRACEKETTTGNLSASAMPAGKCVSCGRLSAQGNLLPGRSARALLMSAPRRWRTGESITLGIKEAITARVGITHTHSRARMKCKLQLHHSYRWRPLLRTHLLTNDIRHLWAAVCEENTHAQSERVLNIHTDALCDRQGRCSVAL